MNERGYLSIGDALAMLLEEFPDITISKIRFLESQGLIAPERTSAGYRMFKPVEVEKLRIILREQQEHFLPLRVIKDRLDDETSDISRELLRAADAEESIRNHPSHRGLPPRGDRSRSEPDRAGEQTPGDGRGADTFDQVNQTFLEEQRRIARAHADLTSSLERADLESGLGVPRDLIPALEAADMLRGHEVGDTTFYDEREVEIVRLASALVGLGIDIRHVKTWKTVVDRIVDLFGQRTAPMFRQKSGNTRTEAEALLDELGSTGEMLLGVLLRREIERLKGNR